MVDEDEFETRPLSVSFDTLNLLYLDNTDHVVKEKLTQSASS